MTTAKHPGGRPPTYKNKKELQEKIEEYFDSCWVDKVVEVTDKEGNVTTTNSRYQNRPYTITGLALALGFSTRQSLLDYQDKKEFIDTITQAKLKCHMFAEESLFLNKSANGPAFSLKNNFGWKDNHGIEGANPGEAISINVKYGE
jgi:hypothetical protein